MARFHSTDIVHGRDSNWILTVEGWVEIPRAYKLRFINRMFYPAKEPFNENKIVWWVISSLKEKRYRVIKDKYSGWSCQCLGFTWRRKCSHIETVKKDFL